MNILNMCVLQCILFASEWIFSAFQIFIIIIIIITGEPCLTQNVIFFQTVLTANPLAIVIALSAVLEISGDG